MGANLTFSNSISVFDTELNLNIGSVSLLIRSSQNELLSDIPFQNCAKESSLLAVHFRINIDVGQLVSNVSPEDLMLWDMRVHENTFRWWNGCVQGSVNRANNRADVVIDEKILSKDLRLYKIMVLRALIFRAYYQALNRLKDRCELLGHGAAIIKNGYCFVFLGESGSGKTTLCQTTDHGKILNDEIVGLIKTEENFCSVFWTPFAGSFAVPENYSLYPLSGIFFLVQDTKNSIHKIRPLDAALALLRLFLYPGDLLSCDRFKVVSDRLDMCAELVKYVNCYEMHFRKDGGFWDEMRCVEMQDIRQKA